MTRSVRLASAAIAALAVTAVAACSGGGRVAGASNGSPVDGATLNIGIASDPGNLDPQRVGDLNVQMARFAYDTPITLDRDAKVVPGVVTAWKGGGTSYTLTVRKGVTCSDGSAMDAKTVADNINYVGDKNSQSQLTDLAVPGGTTAKADVATGTVGVTLSTSAPFFIQNLIYLPLVCEKGMADRKLLASSSDGSGPFVISEVAPGDHITYTVREGYTWGPNGASTHTKGTPAKLVFKVIKSDTTMANLLLNGQLNIAAVQGSDQNRLKAAHLFSAGPKWINDDLTFNHTSGSAVDDVAVRRALIMALDMKQLAQVDTAGDGTVANGLLSDPKICPGDTMDGNLPGFDLDGAKALLDQAGWTVGSVGVRAKAGKKLSVSLLYGSSPVTKGSAAEFIAAQWRKLGAQVTLDQKPEDQVVSTILGTATTWDVVLEPITAVNPAVFVPFLSGAVPPTGTNFGRIDNAQYVDLVKKASGEDGTAGCADWNAAEASLIKNADILPVSNLPKLFWGTKVRFEVLDEAKISPTTLRALSD
jgi:peptide/nickel transport system substrate-binding protein